MEKKEVTRLYCRIGKVFIGVGVLLFLLAAANIVYSRNIINTYDSADAVIVELNDEDDATAIVIYQVDGETYKESLHYYSSGMELGQQITVYYDRLKPEQVKCRDGLYLLSLVSVINGTVFAVIGIVFLILHSHRAKKIKWLQENGHREYGEIVAVEENRYITINGHHPYRFLIEAVDPYENSKKIYYSDNLGKRFEESYKNAVGQQICVYTDAGNPKSYYVDIRNIIV